MKLNEQVTTIPTIGFNVETVSPCKGLTFTVWDVGGQEKIRRLWRHYYQNTEGKSLMFISTLEWVTWKRYCDITWTSWCLKSPVTGVFVQQFVRDNNKENTWKPCITGPLWGESNSNRQTALTLPSQRASIAGSVSVSFEYSFTGNNYTVGKRTVALKIIACCPITQTPTAQSKVW